MRLAFTRMGVKKRLAESHTTTHYSRVVRHLATLVHPHGSCMGRTSRKIALTHISAGWVGELLESNEFTVQFGGWEVLRNWMDIHLYLVDQKSSRDTHRHLGCVSWFLHTCMAEGQQSARRGGSLCSASRTNGIYNIRYERTVLVTVATIELA